MKRIVIGVVCITMVLAAGLAGAAPKIESKAVEYTAGGVSMRGYLAWDGNVKGEPRGVLVVHEWWGQNEYIRKRARMLAELGYTALALDMFGEGRMAGHPDEAGKFTSELMKNFPVAKDRFLAALEMLRKDPTVDPSRIGAIGFCFGGGVVLNMARQGIDLKGVASFHGSLAVVKPEQPTPAGVLRRGHGVPSGRRQRARRLPVAVRSNHPRRGADPPWVAQCAHRQHGTRRHRQAERAELPAGVHRPGRRDPQRGAVRADALLDPEARGKRRAHQRAPAEELLLRGEPVLRRSSTRGCSPPIRSRDTSPTSPTPPLKAP